MEFVTAPSIGVGPQNVSTFEKEVWKAYVAHPVGRWLTSTPSSFDEFYSHLARAAGRPGVAPVSSESVRGGWHPAVHLLPPHPGASGRQRCGGVGEGDARAGVGLSPAFCAVYSSARLECNRQGVRQITQPSPHLPANIYPALADVFAGGLLILMHVHS